MILIIGGAYQGKLRYACETFHLGEDDIFTCTGREVDFTKPCINALEECTLACTQQGLDPIAYFQEHRDHWENAILICQDIFCGVVPMDTTMRLWRQDTGRLCQYLSREAEQVIRVFCGLEQRLK